MWGLELLPSWGQQANHFDQGPSGTKFIIQTWEILSVKCKMHSSEFDQGPSRVFINRILCSFSTSKSLAKVILSYSKLYLFLDNYALTIYFFFPKIHKKIFLVEIWPEVDIDQMTFLSPNINSLFYHIKSAHIIHQTQLKLKLLFAAFYRTRGHYIFPLVLTKDNT